jgi:hypothetical protein
LVTTTGRLDAPLWNTPISNILSSLMPVFSLPD